MAPDLLPSQVMPRYFQEPEIDPGREPDDDRSPDQGLEEEPIEPDRSVARHAEEAEEAELAEEDILEISELEAELEARKGDGPEA
jgi:hypothetical protein